MTVISANGRGARLDRSNTIDETLRHVFAQSGAQEVGCALVAVGGYGRQEMAPGSDIDFVLLHPSGVDIHAITDEILYPLWDAKFMIDHSVRTVDQCIAMAKEDLRVQLGLLDARLVAGDPELASTLKTQVVALWRKTAKARLPELFEDMDERAARSGELSYLLEPDLKESAGGIRDATILRLIDLSWLVDAQSREVRPALEKLLEVRDALHSSTGRNSDVLTREDQIVVSELLGFDGPDELLRQVLAAGRSIGIHVDQARAAVQELSKPRWFKRSFGGGRTPEARRVPLANDVVLHGNEVALAQGADVDSDQGLTLRLAAAAAHAHQRISPHSVIRLANDAPDVSDPWPRHVRESFVSLLGAGKSTLQVWEVLDQAGIISRMFPEWESLRSTPQHDPIHIYTVDRHSIECAINASGLVREVARPDLLLVGALFHDIGKGRGGEHCEIGVPLVEQIARRMGFVERDVATLAAMVRLHLLLPEVATTRDLADPLIVEYVAGEVGDVETLELLYALTQADSQATGPGVWTSWKASLLDELVSRVKAYLNGSKEAVVSPECDWEDVEDVDLLVTFDQDGDLPAITVRSFDRVGLMADIAGVLTANRLEVRAAEAKTRGTRAYSRWIVEPEFGDLPEVSRICEELRLVEQGTFDLGDKLDRRIKSYWETRKVEEFTFWVGVVEGASTSASVIEVRANNMPGLLSTVARAIGKSRTEILTARASTLGDNAVDTFYLQSGGKPLTADRLSQVRQAVASRLDELRRVM